MWYFAMGLRVGYFLLELRDYRIEKYLRGYFNFIWYLEYLVFICFFLGIGDLLFYNF